MIVCKNCGTENEDDDLYCKHCGKRIDGKKNCKYCNSLISEDCIFCPKCGKRIDGQKQCPNCGNLVKENELFCSKCGTKLGEVKTAKTKVKSEKSVRKTVFFYVENGLALLAGLLALIGVLVIDINVASLKNGSLLELLKNWDSAMGVVGVGAQAAPMKVVLIVGLVISATTAFANLLTSSLLFGIKRKNMTFTSGIALMTYLPVSIFTSGLSSETSGVSILKTGESNIECLILLLMIFVAVEVLKMIDEYMDGDKKLASKILKTVFTLCVAGCAICLGSPLLKERFVSTSDTFEYSYGITYLFAMDYNKVLLTFCLICVILSVGTCLASGVLSAFKKNGLSFAMICSALGTFVVAIILAIEGRLSQMEAEAIEMGAYKYSVLFETGTVFAIIILVASIAVKIVQTVLEKKQKN